MTTSPRLIRLPMIPEFLAFRYQGVRRIDEILSKSSDFGWKCRKYIKWRDVHNSKDDARALYAFANGLLDEGRLRTDLYGQISGVWFNVQKWRLDKENMSVEPPLRKEWGKHEVLFKAAQMNLALIPARLSELKIKVDTFSSLVAQMFFYACELDTFFCAQNIEHYPTTPLPELLLESENIDL